MTDYRFSKKRAKLLFFSILLTIYFFFGCGTPQYPQMQDVDTYAPPVQDVDTYAPPEIANQGVDAFNSFESGMEVEAPQENQMAYEEHGHAVENVQGRWLEVVEGDSGARSGYKGLQMEMGHDPNLRGFVYNKGLPDYIHVIDRHKLELAYLEEGKVYSFSRVFGSDSVLMSAYSVTDPKLPRFIREHVKTGSQMIVGQSDAINLAPQKKQKEQTYETLPNLGEPKKTAGQRWAVVIGISSYADSRIPFLRYAARDAKSFYDWLTSPSGGKYAPARVRLLLNKNATLRNIKDLLFMWLKQAIEEDVVTIYFAGHGSPESPHSQNNLFLLPYDTQYDSIPTTGFPMWDIETALKRFIKAKKIVVIADACHAAGVGQSFDVAQRSNRGIKVNPISSGLQNLSKVGDGVCVMSASGEKQLSQESKDWGGGHGVFTYFLLKGLKGEADYNNDRNVTLGELIPYLSEQVRRETRNAQSPTVAGRFDPALSIGM